MTTPPTLDPAVEEVLVDLAKAKERTLFTCDPTTLARNLGGANTVISANATGLLPVERHLLATMRGEVLHLFLSAAREAIFASDTCNLVDVGQRTPHARWLQAVAAVLVSPSLISDRQTELLSTWVDCKSFNADMLDAAISAGEQLSDAPRVKLYAAWGELRRRAWPSALISAGDLLQYRLTAEEQRAALEIAYVAFDAIGEHTFALEACSRALSLSERMDSPMHEFAVYRANQLLFALRAGNGVIARAAATAVRQMENVPASCAAIRTYAALAQRNRPGHSSLGSGDLALAGSLASEFGGTVKEICLAVT